MNKRLMVIIILMAAALGLVPGAAPAAETKPGHFYVIGTGPSGPQMATLQALETMKRMHALVAPERMVKQFAEYVGDKPVIVDPWKGIWDYKGKPFRKLSKADLAEFRKERFRIRDANVARIKELLAQGKDVALLDSGNPCLFGPSHWYVEQFKPEQVKIIPGMGCDAAAMAALGQSTIPSHKARFVVQTAPFFLLDNQARSSMDFDPDSPGAQKTLADLARHQHTMILYMALKDPEKLFKVLRRHMPADMPAACVYWAGYEGKQRVVRGTLADMGTKLAKDPERFMGLIFVGRFLEGKPYEAAMRRHQGEKE